MRPAHTDLDRSLSATEICAFNFGLPEAIGHVRALGFRYLCEVIVEACLTRSSLEKTAWFSRTPARSVADIPRRCNRALQTETKRR